MTAALSIPQYQLIVEKCSGSTLDAVWGMMDPVHQSWTNFPDVVGRDFTIRTRTFLWVLERLLHEGQIKLHRNGVFLESSIKEQVNAFRSAWPQSVADSGYEDFYWWFFDPECPAGVAWRRDDGNYVIAD